ncbi:MAG: RNA ligase, partial [Pseudomonadota bacterium]|nr:RNA ligase [Pseudomonadota bacterium]
VCGYPKIGRILRLDSGLTELFEHPVHAEEKVDGYNVRVFRHGEDLIALTRRGYVCPFTTDRLPDLIDTSIFARRPDLVLCMEVAGPENPYNAVAPPYVKEDVAAFVFDIMRIGHSGFLPRAERLALVEKHDLPGVPQYGGFALTETARLYDLIRELDRKGHEGVVLKQDQVETVRAKYVTGRINLSDIRCTSNAVHQLPPEYYTERILRLALYLDETGEKPTDALYRQLGSALLDGILAAIDQYRREGAVTHPHRCRFRDKANAELMVASMKRLLGKNLMQVTRLEQQGDYWLLEFEKVLPKTTGLLRNLLRGGLVYD